MACRRWPTLDLFSGIGGFALALRSCCKTVGYCELAPNAVRVLECAMARGDLDRAPVHGDVKQLRGAQVSGGPKLITAGFPCQDASASSTTRNGLEGERSSLAFEVLRLLDETPSVRAVFLENSPFLRVRGLDLLVSELLARGYRVAWGVFSAFEVGAPHLRKRLYILAARNGAERKLPSCAFDHLATAAAWRREPVRRLLRRTPTTEADMRGRCPLLGNSVVPEAVALAYSTLREWLVGQSGAVVHAARGHQVPRDLVTVTLAGDRHKRLWATPTYSPNRWEQYRDVSSERSIKNLANQVYYDEETLRVARKEQGFVGPANRIDDAFAINARWVEWLMGYPRDWTDCGAKLVTTKSGPRSA